MVDWRIWAPNCAGTSFTGTVEHTSPRKICDESAVHKIELRLQIGLVPFCRCHDNIIRVTRFCINTANKFAIKDDIHKEEIASTSHHSLASHHVIKRKHRGDTVLVRQRVGDPTQRSSTEMWLTDACTFPHTLGILKTGFHSLSAFTIWHRHGKAPQQSLQHHRMTRNVITGRAM